LSLALSSNEKHTPTSGGNIVHSLHGTLKQWYGLLEVDNMDPISHPEKIGFHFGIPATGVVPEMTASLYELAHGK
tara:strand:- start:394 stop:618 length:225 start_codon:yes stop_codon:yes gene_type:complete